MPAKPKYRVYGINDDTDTCEVCGKTNLKRVVWMMPLDSEGNEVAAQPMPVGTDCASRMMGWTFGRKQAESRLQAMLIENQKRLVSAKIIEITTAEGWQPFLSMYMPADLIIAIKRCTMTRDEAIAERNTRWPILNYNSGKISLEQAIELIGTSTRSIV